MKIEIIKAPLGEYCLHHACTRDKRYVSPKGRIKRNTTIAKLTIPFKSKSYPQRTVYYCRNCIEQILFDARKILDPKLWIFK
jgi:hypothetical protein